MTALADKVTILTDEGVSYRRDVIVTVHDAARHTDVVVTSPGLKVTLTLRGAERIALIEALGGTATR